MDRWLTEDRKRVFLDTFGWSFNVAFGVSCGVLAAAWIVCALIVGSVDLVRWIGGIA